MFSVDASSRHRREFQGRRIDGWPGPAWAPSANLSCSDWPMRSKPVRSMQRFSRRKLRFELCLDGADREEPDLETYRRADESFSYLR